MARPRTTKALAKRIDLEYFKKPHPFRVWKRNLTWAAVILGVAWPLAAAWQDESIFSAGPVSERHALFEDRCSKCHTPDWARRVTNPKGWQASLDEKCLHCHPGPVHHPNQTDYIRGDSAARCSHCHFEHGGRARLARLTPRHCSMCHASLETTSVQAPHAAECLIRGNHVFAQSIGSFEGDHPEFEILKRNAKDPTLLSFNHLVHMQPGREARKMKLFQRDLARLSPNPRIESIDGVYLMKCSYCHEPERAGAYMKPIHYESHCRDCHPLKLEADPFENPIAVPHQTPAVVRDFLRSRFAAFVADHADDEEWITDQVMDVEQTLYTSDPAACSKCHETELGDDFPDVPPILQPTGIHSGGPGYEGAPRRWFAHSFFNHKPHRELKCMACHKGADSTSKTSDLRLPGRAICLTCHSRSGGAPTTCVECHTFHDPTRARGTEGKLHLRDLGLPQ